nr:hypothetical protein [uncultured Oscillibacter sp.]
MANIPYASQSSMDWSSEISGSRPAAPAAGSPSSASSQALTYPPATTAPDVSPAFQFPSAAAAPSGSMPPAAAAASSGSMPPAAAAVSSGSMPPAAAAASSGSMPPAAPARPSAARNEFAGSTGNLDLLSHQPSEVIESPATVGEAFLGSLKSMLLRNRGNFVAATLLIGTQGTMVWEGILHEVGNDYFIIYQAGRQRYILCDIYALKYMEFYDTRQRELCERFLQENGEKGFC